MTVADLLEAVKNLDPNTEVFIDGDNGHLDLRRPRAAYVVYEVKMEEHDFYQTVHEPMLQELVEDYGHEPFDTVPVLFIQAD